MVSLDKLADLYDEERARTEDHYLALLAVYDYGWNEGFSRAETQALAAISEFCNKLEGN